jgi:hypothetical protein
MHLHPSPTRRKVPAAPRPSLPSPTRRHTQAFTLLEVTLAMAILFAITFVLLQITSTNLRVAKLLQRTTIDASSLAAELSLTNRLEEGAESGDFGDLYPDHTWRREITLVGTNGLFECRFEVLGARDDTPESELVVLLFRPDSARGTAGATLRGR